MTRSNEFVEFVLEGLQPLRGVSARRMFGGWGIYKDGVMFAGLPHFTYAEKGKPIRMPYREAPSEGFDDPEILCAWAREAYAAALRTKKHKRR